MYMWQSPQWSLILIETYIRPAIIFLETRDDAGRWSHSVAHVAAISVIVSMETNALAQIQMYYIS